MSDNLRALAAFGILAGALYWAFGDTQNFPFLEIGPDGTIRRGSGPAGAPVGQGYTREALDAALAANVAAADSRPYVNPEPSTGAFLGKTALGAGTSLGAGAVAAGGLTAGALAATGIGAGAALLTYFVVNKGLFRGGEEGVKVNPARDQYLLQFGPPSGQAGVRWEDSGAGRLAAALTEITGEGDGSHYWKALMEADTMAKFVPATREIQAVLATVGIDSAAF